eukprot:5272064-Amphidinium_carterae.1
MHCMLMRKTLFARLACHFEPTPWGSIGGSDSTNINSNRALRASDASLGRVYDKRGLWHATLICASLHGHLDAGTD